MGGKFVIIFVLLVRGFECEELKYKTCSITVNHTLSDENELEVRYKHTLSENYEYCNRERTLTFLSTSCVKPKCSKSEKVVDFPKNEGILTFNLDACTNYTYEFTGVVVQYGEHFELKAKILRPNFVPPSLDVIPVSESSVMINWEDKSKRCEYHYKVEIRDSQGREKDALELKEASFNVDNLETCENYSLAVLGKADLLKNVNFMTKVPKEKLKVNSISAKFTAVHIIESSWALPSSFENCVSSYKVILHSKLGSHDISTQSKSESFQNVDPSVKYSIEVFVISKWEESGDSVKIAVENGLFDKKSSGKHFEK
jgi:hypothetical protein